MKYAESDVIGASVSEPHTSEFNGGISLIHVYIYIYVGMYRTSYVQCTCTRNECGQYACDLTNTWVPGRSSVLSWGSR